jgi:hypothetical protein
MSDAWRVLHGHAALDCLSAQNASVGIQDSAGVTGVSWPRRSFHTNDVVLSPSVAVLTAATIDCGPPHKPHTAPQKSVTVFEDRMLTPFYKPVNPMGDKSPKSKDKSKKQDAAGKNQKAAAAAAKASGPPGAAGNSGKRK